MHYPLTKCFRSNISINLPNGLMLTGRYWQSWNSFMHDDCSAWLIKKSYKREKTHCKAKQSHAHFHTRTEGFRWMAVWDKKKSKASIGTMPKYTRSLVSKKTTANSASVVCLFGPHIRLALPSWTNHQRWWKRPYMDYQHKNIDASVKIQHPSKKKVCWSPIPYSVIL